jgi:hypothetical protein
MMLKTSSLGIEDSPGACSGELQCVTENYSLSFPTGFSKMFGCKAPETLRSEAYWDVHRSNEG